MIIENDNIPLTFQFFLKIRGEILLGKRLPGERIPTIKELSKAYGFSVAPIRQALNLLQKTGLISKKPGVGIHVRNPLKLGLYKLPRSLSLERDFLPWEHYLISEDWIKPPKYISNFFQGIPHALEDGRLIQYRCLWISKKEKEHRWLCKAHIPASLYYELNRQTDDSDSSLLQKLFESPKYGGTPMKHVETIHPWICDAESAKYLEVLNGTPIFQISWKLYSENGEPIWISEDQTSASTIVRERRTMGLKG